MVIIASASLAVLAACLIGPVTASGGCNLAHAGVSAAACAASLTGFGPVRIILAVLGSAGLLIAVSIAWDAERHRRLARLLDRLAEPAVLGDMPVGVVDGVGPACVAGLRHPRIYCASDLAARLEPVELRAVLLHERHHQIDHAPARFILLDALARPLERLAMGRGWLTRARARIEIAADRYALASGATRADLASALIKLGAHPAPSGVAAYTASSELRLRALLGDPPERASSWGLWVVSSLVAAAALLACLLV
ncbi:MAG: hypothetical protein ABJC39_12350 [Chloroflexota bacterium]